MTKDEALDKKADNAMIYKTFEQWMNGDFLEVGEPRKKAYSEDELLLVEMGWNYGYDAGRAVEQALDKKAENARELGLDYEPAQQEPVLQDIEQYRLQMAGISTAAIGYWKESDGIHPDYDTIALRDVAKLYAKYDELYRAQRTWVGLTDEDIEIAFDDTQEGGGFDDFARAIEAKLKEKNT